MCFTFLPRFHSVFFSWASANLNFHPDRSTSPHLFANRAPIDDLPAYSRFFQYLQQLTRVDSRKLIDPETGGGSNDTTLCKLGDKARTTPLFGNSFEFLFIGTSALYSLVSWVIFF